MAKFDQNAFNELVLDNDIVGFYEKPVTLNSGAKSRWYVNWRDAVSDVWLTEEVSRHVLAFVQDLGLEPDCFYGVPDGATKIANSTQTNLAKASPDYGPGSHALPMGRATPKEHGVVKDKYFVGQPRGKTIIIEDVTTTGGSLVKTVHAVREIEDDVEIIYTIGLTDRMERRSEDNQSVPEVLDALGIPYGSMSNGPGLLPLAYARANPGEDLARYVEQEFRERGVIPVKLIGGK